jgi:hypothetical protein
MDQNVLLLFSPQCPCWDEETIRTAGDNPDSLEQLEKADCLTRLGGGYVLTPFGCEQRRRISAEFCVPVQPIDTAPADNSAAHAALERCRMYVFLDHAFKTQWGIKEVTIGESFPVVPALPDNGYFSIENGRAKALWPENPLIRSLRTFFPKSAEDARKDPAPGQNGLKAWAAHAFAGETTLTVDFMLRSRADFAHYKNIRGLDSDIYSFYNTDRIFAFRCPEDLHDFLPVLGRLHVFMEEQRRIFVPGHFDLDAEEQECWTLLCLVTDTEAELEKQAQTLQRWGHALIDPARPLYLIGTSIERLRAQKEIKDTIYDWFQEETMHIMRPDAPDGE